MFGGIPGGNVLDPYDRYTRCISSFTCIAHITNAALQITGYRSQPFGSVVDISLRSY